MAIIHFDRPLQLATASEARRALVAATGIPHTVMSVDIDETPLQGEEVGVYVERLARAKAEAATPISLDAIIVSVDTAIGLDGQVIGKPRDKTHAREILRVFSGRAHEVVSAIAVRDLLAATCRTEVTRTEVRMAPLTSQAIEWYLESEEWQGRAGAYAIQGKGAILVEEVKGCLTNVIGISMPVLLHMLTSSTSDKTT